MTRLLMFLLGRDYEPCKSCELLKQQLEMVNNEKDRMLQTILDFTKPVAYVQNDKPIAPISPAAMPWRIRKQLKENEDRAAFDTLQRIKNESQKLEDELGVGDAQANEG